MRHKMNHASNIVRILALAGVAAAPLALLGPTSAEASSSSAGDEFLSNAEAAPPNVVFLLDLSDAMDEDCAEAVDTGEGEVFSASGSTCLEDTLDAIDQLTQHYDWAYFGIVGTEDGASKNYPVGIAPLGSSHADISTALSSVTVSGSDTRNLSEVLYDVANDYLDRQVSTASCTGWSSSSYVTGEDFCGVPVQWACQETHVITITVDRPNDDYNAGLGHSSISPDTKCTWSSGITTGTDEDCGYDNVVYNVYNNDLRSDMTGDQNVVTHTIAIKVNGTSIAEELYGNSVDQIGNEGIYTVANSGDEILGSIMTVMSYIRSGYYSRSTPVISVDGERIIYSFYEVSGDNPLAEGHVRSYKIDTDPTSTTYGEVVYDGDSQFGGAQWDAGDLLVSRPVSTSEDNPDDMDGFGRRDIFTFIPEVYDYGVTTALSDEGDDYHRMGFDAALTQAVIDHDAAGFDLLGDVFFDTTDTDSDGCADDLDYDFTKDGCYVDSDDMQEMIDFVRGLSSSEFRYISKERGSWKLGDSPHSIPVVTGARDDIFAVDPTYQAFLKDHEDDAEVVFIAANDGMLHAFRLYDDTSTTSNPSPLSTEDADEAGEELWAWIPAYLTYKERDAEWASGLADMMWYGRTFLFDGSPVVEDVWIDEDLDGVKAVDGSEWRRVIVVQQGKGGPVTLALDITDPSEPEFLWEQTNDIDNTAMGYTVSRPVVGNLYNQEDTSNPKDAWTVMWGGGRAVPYSTDESYYTSSEANLYFWHVADDYWNQDAGTLHGDFDEEGSNGHPDSSASGLDSDSDSRYEYAYISGALAAVDTNSDGDVDVLYFPVTTSYEPTDEGGEGPTDSSGADAPADPGHTWMYKAIIDVSDVDDPEWCEFYDPLSDISARPEVYYSATTAWHSDGGLGVYWGTGSPYDRESGDAGYFFAMKDAAPLSCSSTATSLSCAGNDGYYPLASGEGLTGDPVVFAGTVYFSTYEPALDRCDGGTGRIYALSFEDCSATTDLDGSGSVTAADAYVEVDGYPSAVAVSENGTVYYGTSNPDPDGTTTIGEVTAATDPFAQVITLGMRDVF
ncbi:MAG: hypothetical protein GY913_12230 [Proteobacteria bacterium]|nr:hypothetical protein [Pseudomonadota bacterium]MCP4917683.1 hypothetical protein [Pseudomonadota bacterium]